MTKCKEYEKILLLSNNKVKCFTEHLLKHVPSVVKEWNYSYVPFKL